jgi:hypothetical protein
VAKEGLIGKAKVKVPEWHMPVLDALSRVSAFHTEAQGFKNEGGRGAAQFIEESIAKLRACPVNWTHAQIHRARLNSRRKIDRTLREIDAIMTQHAPRVQTSRPSTAMAATA